MKLTEYLKKDISSFEKIIGIDIGHGETSASIFRQNEVYDLALNAQSERKIITALFISNDEQTIKIGYDAIQEPTSGKKYIRFKARPDWLNQKYPNDTRTKKQILQVYFKAVVDSLYKYNSNLNIEDKHKTLIFVGCPSSNDWKDMGNRYASILSEATGMCVITMPESRASLIKTYKDGIIDDISTGAVALDSGSSTFDATYIYGKGKSPTIDISKRLGASLIEENMIKKALKENGYEISKLNDRENTEIDFRMAKERYFEHGHCSVIYKLKPDEAGGKIIIQSVIIDDEFMKDVTENMEIKYGDEEDGIVKEKSWKSACENFYLSVKKEINQMPLSTVICTGGASRMAFSREVCQDVFEGITVETDYDPSFCVSRGLAIAGETDYKCAEILKQIEQEIKDKIEESLIQPAQAFSIPLAEEIYNIALNEISIWADQEIESRTSKDIEKHIQDKGENYIKSEEAKTLLREYFNKWADSLKPDITAIIKNRFEKEYPNSIDEIRDFYIDESYWEKIHSQSTKGSIESIGLDLYVYNFLENIVFYASKPILFIANFGGVLLEEFFGLDAMNKVEKLVGKGSKQLKIKTRTKAKDKFIEDKDKFIQKTKEKIYDSINKGMQDKKSIIAENIYVAISESIEDAVDTISLNFK